MSPLELAKEIARLELELEFDPRKNRLAELIRAFGVTYASTRRVAVCIGGGRFKPLNEATDQEIAHQLANQLVWRTATLEENLAEFDRNRAVDRSTLDPRGGPLKYDDIERHQVTGGDPKYTARLNQAQQIEAVFLQAELDRRRLARS